MLGRWAADYATEGPESPARGKILKVLSQLTGRLRKEVLEGKGSVPHVLRAALEGSQVVLSGGTYEPQ